MEKLSTQNLNDQAEATQIGGRKEQNNFLAQSDHKFELSNKIVWSKPNTYLSLYKHFIGEKVQFKLETIFKLIISV